MPDARPPLDLFFAVFNEVGIIEQLSRALFEARLKSGFTVAQFAVLNHLVRVSDGRTPIEMARAFQVPKTSMTHSLSVLERHGLIRMDPNARDGRSKRVFITEAGRTFRAEAIAALAPDAAILTARFSQDRIAALLPILSDLRQIMDKMRDTP